MTMKPSPGVSTSQPYPTAAPVEATEIGTLSVSWTVTVCLTVWLILAPSGQAAATLRLEGLSPGADPRIILTRAGGEGCRDEVIQKGGRAITLSGPCWSCPAPSALPHAEEHGGEIRVAVLARNHSVAYLTGSSILWSGRGRGIGHCSETAYAG